MTERNGKSGTIDVKALLAGDEEFLGALVRTALQEVLEVEMTQALGAEKGERTADRLGYRSGYYGRTLITRIGWLERREPQDRDGRFSTELFERYQRSERALVAALAEMYVQGVSTRKVKGNTEELRGHSFSASSISAINQKLDASLAQFAVRPLAEAFPYLILDARYERVREAGVISSQAVLIAIGIDWDGRGPSAHGLDPWGQVLAIELANRESRSSWRDFLRGLKARGLHGVEFVVADDHAGLRAALREELAEAAYQRCYVHSCATRKRRAHVVRIFPNAESCLRLVWRSQWRSTRTGSNGIATSTWTICASTKRRGCAVWLDPQPGRAWRRARRRQEPALGLDPMGKPPLPRRWPKPPLTAAARAARGTSGRDGETVL